MVERADSILPALSGSLPLARKIARSSEHQQHGYLFNRQPHHLGYRDSFPLISQPFYHLFLRM